MSERWVYRLNNEEFGPIVGDQVVELIRSQILTSVDWIRAENASGWSPLGRVDAFREELNQNRSDDLEIAGSLDDLTFEFAETSASSSGLDSARSKAGRQHAGGASDRRPSPNNDAVIEAPQPLAAVTATRARQEVETAAPEFDSRTAVADLEDVSESDSTQGTKSRAQASPKQAPQSATGERKKVKRKTAKPEDPLLDEIIRELSDRSKSEPASSVTASRPLSSPPSASALSATPTASAPAPSPPAVATKPVSNLSPSMSNSSMSNSAPKMNSYTPPAVKPAPVRAKRSFQMPEPKTIGIVGGGLVSVLLVAALMLGWISLPFGSSGGALSGNAGAVVSCYLEFKQFGTAIPAGPEWVAFCSTVEKNIKPVVGTSADAKDNVTEAGRKLLELASLQPMGNPEKFKQIGGELEVLIAGITGTK